MRTFRVCNFQTIEDQFNFGRYNGLSLADVLDINPSYIHWCVKHCTGIIFQLEDEVINQIKTIRPRFIIDALFESNRMWNLSRNIYYDSDDDDNFDIDEYDSHNYDIDIDTYDRYAESWAQSEENYSDDEIDTIFDGDPSAYWNID